jgi:uncharacterized protein (TIGR02145 family)
MKQIYTIGLIILTLTISQQAFPQKENAKDPLNGEQQIELSEGYSFISSRIIAPDPDMLVVLESILNDNLDFVRNSQGQVLRKIGPNWINGIGDWIIEEGYLVKMFAGDSFIIEGDVVDPVTPIPLELGYQFISYFPDTLLDALIAFETILGDDLDFIRNSQGEILRKIGPNWINGIGNCNPGEGYLVKMLAGDILIYPGSSSFTCSDPLTYEGQVYNTVLIGNQCWFKENLNIGTMINGNENMSNNGVIEKYCYNNDPAYCEIYGGLYQWNEMMEYSTTAGVQGICPNGWHLPKNGEWTILTDFLGGESVAGGKMKETGTTHWNSPNTGATNESGFTGLPAGWRSQPSNFSYLGNWGLFWSSSENNTNNAWFRRLSYDNDNVSCSNYYKSYGLSSRCMQDSGGQLPTVTTATITNITQTTATSGGNVFYNGGYPVTARGVCWSTNENPTINDNYTTDGSGTGVFISEITGLTANTSYYVRAYATNSEGTAYGCQETFSTDVPCPGITTVTYEGQVYNTVLIGNQCWFKENLNVGTKISYYEEMTDNGVIEKYCFSNDPANCEIYGGLYQWNEMMEYTTTPGVQGICPSGWHLPTDEEWTILTDFLGGESVAGGKMKETGTYHWWSPNTGATNESGFTALPGGIRLEPFLSDLGRYGYFWSSSETDPYCAWSRFLHYEVANVCRFHPFKSWGLSSRCLQYSGGPLPIVTTATITNITQTTATSGGNVFYNGGYPVTARGICWSTNENPTLNDNYTTDGSGTGVFISEITGLTAYTSYYVRAYATNSEGTAYGNQETFTTLSGGGAGEPCPGIPTVTYEGQVYNTVLIGNQCWFKENLNVGTMINGTVEMTNNGVIEKYCYDNDPANCATYGGLYQWNEMMEYTTSPGVQGICPAGWHLPTDGEWTVLTDFLGGESVAGGKMKETGTTHWYPPNYGATNESGFTALPGGSSNTTGGFSYLTYYGYFWSSSESSTSSPWLRMLNYSNVNVSHGVNLKSFGFSSRCLQD